MDPRDTRASAMAAALDLAMTRPDASLDEVAIRAGIGRATLFRHFPNRTALLREAGRRVVATCHARLDAVAEAGGGPERRLRAMVDVLVEEGLPLHALLSERALAEDAILQRETRALDRWIGPVLQDCIAEGVLRADIDPAWFDAAFEGLLYAAWTSVRSGALSAPAASVCVCDTLLHGFGAGRAG